MHEGVSLSEDEYELCAKLENIPELKWIPSTGYFGVTAATGGLSDDHDVMSFITHTLVPLEDRKDEVCIPLLGFLVIIITYVALVSELAGIQNDYLHVCGYEWVRFCPNHTFLSVRRNHVDYNVSCPRK